MRGCATHPTADSTIVNSGVASVACMLHLTACVAVPHTLPLIHRLLISGVGCVRYARTRSLGFTTSRPSETDVSDGLLLSYSLCYDDTNRNNHKQAVACITPHRVRGYATHSTDGSTLADFRCSKRSPHHPPTACVSAPYPLVSQGLAISKALPVRQVSKP